MYALYDFFARCVNGGGREMRASSRHISLSWLLRQKVTTGVADREGRGVVVHEASLAAVLDQAIISQRLELLPSDLLFLRTHSEGLLAVAGVQSANDVDFASARQCTQYVLGRGAETNFSRHDRFSFSCAANVSTTHRFIAPFGLSAAYFVSHPETCVDAADACSRRANRLDSC